VLRVRGAPAVAEREDLASRSECLAHALGGRQDSIDAALDETLMGCRGISEDLDHKFGWV